MSDSTKAESKPILQDVDKPAQSPPPASSQEMSTIPAAPEDGDNTTPNDGGTSSQSDKEAEATGEGRCNNKCLSVLLTTGFVIFGVMWQIALPICTKGLVMIGSDVYPLLLQPFWAIVITLVVIVATKGIGICEMSCKPDQPMLIFGAGASNVLTCVLQYYGSVPRRTPPQLQVLLSTVLVPFTVLARCAIYRQVISRAQGLCVVFVMIGLIVSMIPQFMTSATSSENIEDFGKKEDLADEPPELPVYARVLWPIVFAIGYLPLGMMVVFVEKELVNKQPHPLVLQLYVQIFTFLSSLALFWTDIIPGFGMASDLDEFWHHLKRGIQCSFTSEDGCGNFAYRWWLGTVAYTCIYMLQFMQICYSSGAIYCVLVLSTALPLGTIFWTLFSDHKYLGFMWDPKFTVRSTFVFLGLVILMPAIVTYDYLQAVDKNKTTKDGFERMD